MFSPKNKRVILAGWGPYPLQIPREIFEQQASLGPVAALVWINLVAFAQRRHSIEIEEVAEAMGLTQQEINQALALLADRGWLSDDGLEIQLAIPSPVQTKRETDLIEEGVLTEQETAVAIEGVLDEEQASFEWLISHWSARVATPSQEEMRKLLYWMETRGLSHEVIAVAVEEMFATASNPGFPYLEGILRNWHSAGIRTYSDLLANPH